MSSSSLPPRQVTPRGPTLDIRQIIVYGVAGTAILGSIAYALIRFRDTAAKSRQAEQVAQKQTEAKDAVVAAVDEAKKAAAERELAKLKAQAAAEESARMGQRQLGTFLVEQTLRRGERILGAIDSLQQEIDTATKINTELLTGEKGKRIAADRKAAEQYHAIVGKATPETPVPQSLREDVERLLVPTRQGKTGDPANYMPNEQIAKELEAIERQVSNATTVWRDRNRRLTALVNSTPVTVPAGTPTLQEVLDQLENEWAVERNRIEATLVEKVRHEDDLKSAELMAKLKADQDAADRDATERVRKAHNTSTRELGKIKADEIEAQTQRVVAEAVARVAEKAKKAQEEKLLSEFEVDLPEIQRLLRGLITEGRTQPGHYGPFEVATTRGPVSFTALGRMGGLEATIESQQKLYYSLGTRANDRDRGSFPNYTGGHDDWLRKAPTVQRAQELLIKYGPLMVEKKMLAP